MKRAAREKRVHVGANQKCPDQTDAPSATDSAPYQTHIRKIPGSKLQTSVKQMDSKKTLFALSS